MEFILNLKTKKMKKTILKKLLLTVFTFGSIIAYSQNAYNVSVNNDMLVFATTEDYKNVIALNPTDKATFVQFVNANMNFSSLSRNQGVVLYNSLNDGFIDVIVNKDGYIQLGDYIYKVDPSAALTPVINKANFTPAIKHAMDAHDYSNSYIRAYSIDDDVIGMVESNTPPSDSRLFCNEGAAGGKEASKHIDLNSPNSSSNCGWVDCWVKYVHAGIYFHLYARYNNTCSTRTILYHKTPVQYKVKCGYSSGAPYYQWDITTGNVLGVNWTDSYYQNIQPLYGYWLRIVFMAKDKNWIGNPDNPSADLEIRQNL
jgi:hypothetical protein